MKKLALVLLITATLQHCRPHAERSVPPKGYHWEDFSETRVSFWMPDGWHRRSAGDGHAHSYYVARDNLSGKMPGQVALSILVMPRLTDRVASDYNKEFIANVCRGKKMFNVLEPKADFLIGNGCICDDDGDTFYILMLANPTTNTLYQFIFNAPEGEWHTMWPVGERMIRSSIINPVV
jgi:hypothetical protein